MPVSGLLLAASAATRIASLNLCTDELALLLAPPKTIVSVSRLSRDPDDSTVWQAARKYPGNDGSLMSVVRYRPSLVLTMGGMAKDRSEIARRLGIQVVVLPYPHTLDDVRRSVALVADAVGDPEKGRKVVAAIDRIEASTPPHPIDAAWLSGAGRSAPPRGLTAAWMRVAGFRQLPIPNNRLTLEQLMVRPSPVLVKSRYRANQYSLDQQWLDHPVLTKLSSRTVETDGRPWACGGPAIMAEIMRLRNWRRP